MADIFRDGRCRVPHFKQKNVSEKYKNNQTPTDGIAIENGLEIQIMKKTVIETRENY